MSSQTVEHGDGFLSQEDAIKLDQELFTEFAFSVDQLMELAGLSVATAVAKSYPVDKYNKPIICCGPGNNGGDGLVCARHLKLFGYSPIVVCPKPAQNQLYKNLITQCQRYQIEVVLNQLTEQTWQSMGVDLMIDAIFGFSFKPPNRNRDFAKLLNMFQDYSDRAPLVSVDIPSGWHVETGPITAADQTSVPNDMRIPALQPDCLVSLTAPKQCARFFKGRYHYVGGRFCPKSLEEKYSLKLPIYPGTECVALVKS